MSTPGLDDLGARVLEIVRALSAGKDDATEALKDLVPADVGDRVAAAQQQVESAAAAVKSTAEKALADATSAAASRIADAEKTSTQGLKRLAEERTKAGEEADRAINAAEAAYDQAAATGDRALEEATRTRDAALAAAEKAKADAERAFADGKRAAEEAVADAKAAAEKATQDAQQKLDEAVEEAKRMADEALSEAKRMVDKATAAAAALPDRLTGLGDDALEKLDQALVWPSGVMSLFAKLLIWLKRNCFSDVDQLQVVWQTGEPGPLGLGLLWQDGPNSLRVLFRPATSPDAGDTLLISSVGTDEHSIEGKGISIKVVSAAGQDIVIGKGAPPVDLGPGGVSVSARFPTMRFQRELGPLVAVVEEASVRASVHHTGSWSYEVSVELPRYGGSMRPSQLFEDAGLPIPIAIPSIDEYRSLTIGVADGKTVLREGAATR